MDKVQQILDKINSGIQHEFEIDEDNAICEACEELGVTIDQVFFDSDTITAHRWYEETFCAYSITENDTLLGYVGGNQVTMLYSEQSSIEDIYYQPKFTRLKRITKVVEITKYIPIKEN